MSSADPPGHDAHEEPGNNKTEPAVTPPATKSESDKTAHKNPCYADCKAKPKKHDAFDWVSLAVLVLTFCAAGLAAREAGRLANITDQLAIDARGLFKLPYPATTSMVGLLQGTASCTCLAAFLRENGRGGI
jgi:hypothetical protein